MHLSGPCRRQSSRPIRQATPAGTAWAIDFEKQKGKPSHACVDDRHLKVAYEALGRQGPVGLYCLHKDERACIRRRERLKLQLLCRGTHSHILIVVSFPHVRDGQLVLVNLLPREHSVNYVPGQLGANGPSRDVPSSEC